MYTLHRRTFANGREEWRVRVNGLWMTEVIREFARFDNLFTNVRIFADRASAEKACRADWERWLSLQPLIDHAPEYFDPLCPSAD